MTRFFRNLALATTALLPLGIGFALAGPTGGVVVGGDATITGQGTRNVTIDQWSRRAIINWYTFNIGEGETTRFIQPDAHSVVLNRITGGVGPTEIFGTLTANGRVFVINRDGILFGPNSVVDTAGFLATTSDIKNEDFMAGRYNFNIPGRPDASIVNHGTITAHSAGFAALVAPGVRNTGTITATLGTVGLAAGNSFTLDLYGDRLITLAVGDSIAGQVRDVQTGQTLNSLVENSGRLRANGGRVELTAAAARTVVDSVINNTGVVEANRIGKHGGTIVLSAATAATKGADAPKQTVKVSGTLSAAAKKGGKGGKVVVTGEDIKLTAAHVDVSGPAGGGTVLIGGDWGGGSPISGLVKHPGARLENEKIATAATVTIDRNTVINASATASGTGGKVIVWSDEKTSFAGTILATGGPSGGDGGFAEVSGHLLDFKGAVDLRAPMGTVGTLLLDPLNYYINNSGEAPENDPSASAIAASTIQTLLQTAHVTITTQAGAGSAGDIFVQSSITWATAFSLTLSAFHDINIMPGVRITNTYAGPSPGTLLTLRADNTGSNPDRGTVNFLPLGCEFSCSPAKIDFSQSTGKVAIYYNPRSFDGENRYLNPVDYRTNVLTNQAVPKQLTAYMLVNNADDLSAIGQNNFTLSQTYALGKSFSADEFNGFGAGTRFTGIFDGYGGIGQNNTISDLTTSLFPIIGAGGIVRNLDLANVQINTDGVGGTYGALAGLNEGTIDHVRVINGFIDASASTGVIVGGLVGQNDGEIISSSAAVSVSGGGTAGGLVGLNSFSGIINNSYVTGAVTVISAGLSDMTAGGLVGDNQGTITNSYATGAVSSTGGDIIALGGLVGFNSGTITNSYATGNVTASTSAGSAVLFLGGLVGGNEGEITNSYARGNVSADNGFVFAGGFVGLNFGAIRNTVRFDETGALVPDATGNVTLTGAATGVAGGFAGANFNFITGSVASGAVTAGDNTFLGGFAGWNGALISQSYASGAVTGGNNSFVGGFAALNIGEINGSAAAGAVAGGNNSFVGGLVAVNIAIPGYTSPSPLTPFEPGLISHSYAIGDVAGGDNSFVGGLVALNLGGIDQTFSIGRVSGGAGSTLGGLIALNSGSFDVPIVPFARVSGQTQLASATAAGSVTNSYWDVQRSGQLTSAGGDPFPQGVGLPPGFDSTWLLITYPCQPSFCGGLPSPTPPGPPPPVPVVPDPPPPVPVVPDPPPPGPPPPLPLLPVLPDLPPIVGPVLPPLLPPPVLVDLRLPPPAATQQVVDVRQTDPQPTTPSEVVSTQPTTTGSTNSRPSNQASGNAPLRPDGRPSNVPPVGETRFINNEVVFQICGDVPAERIQTTIRRLRLNVLSSQSLGLIGCTVYHSRITTGRSVRDIIIALERDRLIDEVTPNYTFALAQDAGTPAPATEGDAAQYAIAKLRLADAHQLAKGDNVLIAVIDSEIDAKHPDLEGAIAGRYDAVGPADKPHPHGTGMAGAIASHRKLIGTAPGARILAIRAFGGGGSAGAQGTTVQIVKGIDWAIGQGAKIVNMSFAGPKDPTLQKAFKAAHDKGVVLIAAAGNAGPKSPPLYPGADANVIAVSATDADDKVYTNANRGKYVAVAAPGVDILVPAPEGNYEFTTGTSVASAEVSGVAALLLQLDPKMDPATVREILTSTANRLGAKDRTDELGYGLVDAYRALLSVNAKSASAPAAVVAAQRN